MLNLSQATTPAAARLREVRLAHPGADGVRVGAGRVLFVQGGRVKQAAYGSFTERGRTVWWVDDEAEAVDRPELLTPADRAQLRSTEPEFSDDDFAPHTPPTVSNLTQEHLGGVGQ